MREMSEHRALQESASGGFGTGWVMRGKESSGKMLRLGLGADCTTEQEDHRRRKFQKKMSLVFAFEIFGINEGKCEIN